MLMFNLKIPPLLSHTAGEQLAEPVAPSSIYLELEDPIGSTHMASLRLWIHLQALTSA